MENVQKSKRKPLKKIIYYSVLWFLIFLIISFISFIIFAKKNKYIFNIFYKVKLDMKLMLEIIL